VRFSSANRTATNIFTGDAPAELLENRNVIQKRFRAISNIVYSGKRGSLGIALKALRSSREIYRNQISANCLYDNLRSNLVYVLILKGFMFFKCFISGLLVSSTQMLNLIFFA